MVMENTTPLKSPGTKAAPFFEAKKQQQHTVHDPRGQKKYNYTLHNDVETKRYIKYVVYQNK